MLRQPLDNLHVVGRAQEQVRGVRDLRAHAVHRRQLLLGSRHQRVHARECARQRFGHGFAHMAHPQAEQRTGERTRTRLVDGRHQLLRDGLPQADRLALLVRAARLQLRQLHLVERVVIRHVADAAGFHQAAHDLLAHAVDVHGTAASPMQQALKRLSRAINGNAAIIGLAVLADHGAAAARALLGHAPGLRIVRTQAEHGAQHLGDHVAGLAHDDRIAHAHIFAQHLVLVVQRGAGNGRARHQHRVHLRHRRQFARAPHLHGDVAQKRGLLLGRELERNGPARRAGRVAHGLLLRERVHLHHHAVDIVRQRVAALQAFAAELVHLFRAIHQRDVGVHVESRFAQPLEQVPLRFRHQLALVAHGVHERGQVTVRRDLRVLLAKAAGGGVARVGERLLAVGLGGGVERLEAGFGHVAFAAQLDGGIGVADAGQGAVAQTQRHVLHRAHVHRDVLARGAVAARGRADKAAAFVGERHRRAVDLQLAHQFRDGAEELLDARQPFVKLLGAHGVVERIHAALVLDGRELLAHVAAHALRGAGRVDELGMRRLERTQLVHQRVERGVADGGCVLGVVQIAVVLDLATQRLDARGRIAGRLRQRLPA